jgi:hypothetical protein
MGRRITISCDVCGNKACGVWGYHLYCWDCFLTREQPDTPVDEFEQGIEAFLEQENGSPAPSKAPRRSGGSGEA